MLEIIQQLDQIDAQIFLFFNGMHAPFWDHFMLIYSSTWIWVPLYLSFFFVMMKNFPIKVTLTTLLVIALLILCCDQTASGLIKPWVARLRPSNLDNPLSQWVHVVNGYRGGRYGFPSSHSANTWGLTFFAMYLVRNRKLTFSLSIWALLTCYSRMYLGVHYFGDITVGALIGFAYASIHYYIYQHFLHSYTDGFKQSETLRYSSMPICVGLITIATILAASGVMMLIEL